MTLRADLRRTTATQRFAHLLGIPTSAAAAGRRAEDADPKEDDVDDKKGKKARRAEDREDDTRADS